MKTTHEHFRFLALINFDLACGRIIPPFAPADLSRQPDSSRPYTQRQVASGTETIEGVVVNQADTPIAGARVSLRSKDDRKSLEHFFETYTDSAGKFVFAELPSGTFSLSPTKFEESGAMSMGSNKDVQSGRKDIRLLIRQKLQ